MKLKNLKKILFLTKVKGESMYPQYKDQDLLLASSLPYVFRDPKIGEHIVFVSKKYNKFMVKRISIIKSDGYMVEGLNKHKSTDPEDIGVIRKEEIIGKVLHKIHY